MGSPGWMQHFLGGRGGCRSLATPVPVQLRELQAQPALLARGRLLPGVPARLERDPVQGALRPRLPRRGLPPALPPLPARGRLRCGDRVVPALRARLDGTQVPPLLPPGVQDAATGPSMGPGMAPGTLTLPRFVSAAATVPAPQAPSGTDASSSAPSAFGGAVTPSRVPASARLATGDPGNVGSGAELGSPVPGGISPPFFSLPAATTPARRGILA